MDWTEAQERLRAPIYAPLRATLDRFPAERWPDHAALTEAASGIATARGLALRFVAPRGNDGRERRHYEMRIAETGEVETRSRSWHDLFNALVWIAFPKAKAAINAQHAAILAERGEAESRRRGPERDALTLFDEGGVIVASASDEMARLIHDFRWKELFWHRRAAIGPAIRFIAFGHSLYEKALDPHIGMVAKTVFVPLADGLDADALVAAHFASRANFASPRAMAPMPAMGVPGWYPDTGREAFYDDPVHFRGKTPAPPRKR